MLIPHHPATLSTQTWTTLQVLDRACDEEHCPDPAVGFHLACSLAMPFLAKALT